MYVWYMSAITRSAGGVVIMREPMEEKSDSMDVETAWARMSRILCFGEVISPSHGLFAQVG